MKKMYSIFLLMIVIMLFCSCNKESDEKKPDNTAKTTETSQEKEKFNILHVMSYHRDWEWTEMQLKGFQAAFDNFDIEYTVEAMDCKNHADDEYRNKRAKEIQDYIDKNKPDLVYVSDDEALQYLVSNNRDTDIPYVFSCVNKDLKVYGLDGAKNVTGVFEVEHFGSSFELFKEIVPDVKKVIVIYDRAEIWNSVKERMLEKIGDYPDVDFEFLDPIMTFDEYKKTILKYNGKVDGLCLVGVFNYADEKGVSVNYQDVLKWTEQNSTIPDFTFWIDRIDNGTLCSVAISGYEQGFTAGEMARKILVDKVSPADIETTHTTKGSTAINTKRAQKLGLDIDAELLLSAEVYTKYQWEE